MHITYTIDTFVELLDRRPYISVTCNLLMEQASHSTCFSHAPCFIRHIEKVVLGGMHFKNTVIKLENLLCALITCLPYLSCAFD